MPRDGMSGSRLASGTIDRGTTMVISDSPSTRQIRMPSGSLFMSCMIMVLSFIICYTLSARQLLLLHLQNEVVELVFGKAKFASELLGKRGLGCAGGQLSNDTFAQGGIIERCYPLRSDIRWCDN